MVTPKTPFVVFAALLLAVMVSAWSTSFAADGRAVTGLKGTWSGTLDQFSHDINDRFPVKLTIEAVIGDEFTGTMEWPTFNGCQTRVRGMRDGSLIRWTETAYLKGDDVVLGGLYVARFTADNEMAGDWMDPKHTINPKGPRYGTPGASFVLTRE